MTMSRNSEITAIVNDLVSIESEEDVVSLGNAEQDWPYLGKDEYVLDEVNDRLAKYGYIVKQCYDQWFLERL